MTRVEIIARGVVRAARRQVSEDLIGLGHPVEALADLSEFGLALLELLVWMQLQGELHVSALHLEKAKRKDPVV